MRTAAGVLSERDRGMCASRASGATAPTSWFE
jgi:hypothetical protein